MVGTLRFAHPTKKFCVSLPSQTKREAPMAKKKVASRAAAQPAVKKKWSGHKTAAKSAARKTITSKARGVTAAKRKPVKKVRPKQRIAMSHPRGEDFKADGLRTYAQYRDLGIADATHG